jgi:cobalt-zinc-cadmium efflux system outer membrane protein
MEGQHMLNIVVIRRWVVMLLLAGVAGCTVHPPGESEERETAARLGKPYEKPYEDRNIPALSANPTPEQIVEYALLTNADLEQRYWTWRAAIEQIPQDGTQATSLNIAAGTSITRGHASWGSTTLTLANDPMTDIKWPGKLDAAANQTLENARAAGKRFIKAKYDLRNKVLSAYYDYALTAELIRLEQSNEQLLEITANTTASRNRAGASGQDQVLKTNNEVDLSRNDIENMQSQRRIRLASINAFLNRTADSPLPLPSELPPPRMLAYDDSQLIALAAKQNPELLALADEIKGRHEGIRLAKLQYVPDFNFSAGTDLEGITQSVLGQATIPIFRFEALNAAIAQAEVNLRSSEAMRRQSASDLTAQVIIDISTIRDADRQLDLLEGTILPRARQIVTIGRSSYETGHTSLTDLLDDQRFLIAIGKLAANLRIVREKQVVDLEAITATDLLVKTASTEPENAASGICRGAKP